MLCTKGYTEYGEGDYISINWETKVMFEAVFDGNLFKILEISQLAHSTYDFGIRLLDICHHQQLTNHYSCILMPIFQKDQRTTDPRSVLKAK